MTTPNRNSNKNIIMNLLNNKIHNYIIVTISIRCELTKNIFILLKSHVRVFKNSTSVL